MVKEVIVAQVVSDPRRGKRRLANAVACKAELKKDLILLFKTFEQATQKTNDGLTSFSPLFRARTLEAVVLQSSFAEFLFKNFGEQRAFWGKHRRLVLSLNGYLILFKKLDSKGMPMNTKTENVQALLNQNQTLDLFAESGITEDPVLYFGYKKNKFGEYVDPQIVYIDEGEIQFTISESDIDFNTHKVNIPNRKESSSLGVMPKLRDKRKAQ